MTVRANLSDHRDLRRGPLQLSYDRNAYRWEYLSHYDGVLYHYVDTFSNMCGLSYAVLGRAPPASWSRYVKAFDAATRSLKPICS